MQFYPRDEISFCEQVAVRRADNYTCEAWRGVFGGAPLLLNLAGLFKAARPVITRWRKGTVQCVHVARVDR